MHKRTAYWFVLLVIAVFLCLVPAEATDLRGGENVSIPSGTTIGDDLAAAGSNVSVQGNVTGDLIAAGSTVTTTATIGQTAMVAGGNVNVGGRTGNDIFAAGGQVVVSSTTADNGYVAGGTVSFLNTASVGRDLQIGGGNLQIDGRVGRNLRAAGGTININGVVGGTAYVNGDSVALGPNAVVRGDLIYTSSKQASISPGAKVMGRTVYHHQPMQTARRANQGAWRVVAWFFSLFSMLLLGVILIALFPRVMIGSAERIIRTPLMTLLIGFILLITVPAAAVIAMITVIGLPLGLIALVLWCVFLYLSRIFVSLAIGNWIYARFGRPQVSPYIALIIGLLVLWILQLIPVIGSIVNFLAVLAGLGGVMSELYARVKSSRTEARG